MMEDVVERYQIPAFGTWEKCDEIPITQYLESIKQASLVSRNQYFAKDIDLFKVPDDLVKQANATNHRKVKKVSSGKEKYYNYNREQQWKQGRVCDFSAQQRSVRAPKAVDEDLYKIPPELLYKKPNKKRLLTSLWSGCLGVSCFA